MTDITPNKPDIAPPGLAKPKKAPGAIQVTSTKPAPTQEEQHEEKSEATNVEPANARGTKGLPPLGFKIEAIGLDEDEENWLRILIYGPSGVGKTYLIGTAQDDPQTNSLYIIDAESGKTSIRFKKGAQRTKVTNFSTVEGIVSFLDKYFVFRDKLLAARKAEDEEEIARFEENMAILFRVDEENRPAFKQNIPIFKTVAVDSLTELQVYDMQEIMRDVVKDDPSRDPDVPSPREWGKSQKHIKELIRTIRAMPCHAIFAALPADRTDDKTKEVTVVPDLPGKLAFQVPPLVDIVGYYYSYVDDKEEIQRILLTQNQGKYVAKDRSGALGRYVVNPTIPKMFQMIRDYNEQHQQA